MSLSPESDVARFLSHPAPPHAREHLDDQGRRCDPSAADMLRLSKRAPSGRLCVVVVDAGDGRFASAPPAAAPRFADGLLL